MFISNLRWSLVVRLLTVFSLCSFLQVMANQDGKQKVTVVASDVPLETVFKQIEKQTGLRFMYAVDAMNINERVTVSFKEKMLDEVLKVLLGRKGIVWQYREGTISLKTEKKITEVMSLISDPPVTVFGRVVDAKGNPVPGATIMLINSKKGTKTDSDGNFVLYDVELNARLSISSIGFETREVVASSRNLNIKMNDVIGDLDEAVIIGYGTTTQRFSTGNVASVKAKDIGKQPVSNPLLALQGRVPGLVVTQTSGISGTEVKVQLRGQNSLKNGTQPLYIIDGIPYNPILEGGLGSLVWGGNSSAFNFINPADIESIDVLKDADATAIYGSRGANGVILITTKKGQSGNVKVDINVYRGWGTIADKIRLLNTEEYLKMRREAFKNDARTPLIATAPDLLVWDTTRYTDWQEAMIGGTAVYNNIQSSISGGGANIKYLIGGNYHKETTVFPGTFFSENGGGHINIAGSSNDKKFNTTFTLNYSINHTNLPGSDFVNQITLPPNAPPAFNSDGTINYANSTWTNPYIGVFSEVFDARTNNMLSSVEVNYRLFSALSVKAQLGYNRLSAKSFSGSLLSAIEPAYRDQITGTASLRENNVRSFIFEPQINYNLLIGKGTFNAVLGQTITSNISETQGIVAYGFRDDALIRSLRAASYYTAGNTSAEYKYLAFFGRLSYNFDNRYLLNISLRRDGSSRFGPRKKFANFGSLGVGWIFTEEDFFRNKVPIISYGKIRASYGTTGNDQIGNYQYLDRYEPLDVSYQGIKSIQSVGLFNADFAWELTKKMEVGVELGFLKDRILLTNSFYLNSSTNQLIGYPLPSFVGAGSIVGNLPAKIQNSGFEFVLSSKNVQQKNFEWTTTGNISILRNKLASEPGLGVSTYVKKGESLSKQYYYKVLGVDPLKGTYLFADAQGKPVSSSEAYLSVPVDFSPKFFGGIQNSFRVQDFQLDIFMQFVKQQGRYDFGTPFFYPGTRSNQPINVLDRWQEPDDIASMPRFSRSTTLYYDGYEKALKSDKALSDASFIRIKNVSLSWQMFSKVKEKLHLDNCRIYLQGQNLFTITKYKGLDPETQSLTAIAPLRILTIGIHCIF